MPTTNSTTTRTTCGGGADGTVAQPTRRFLRVLPVAFATVFTTSVSQPVFAQQASAAGSVGSEGVRRTIEVGGHGEVEARPDEAETTFTVLRSAPTARDALDRANEAMRNVVSGMRETGAEDRDLQTSAFSIQPQVRYDQNPDDSARKPPEIVGYEVRNTLTVTIRDVTKVGEVLDKAVSLGVNQGGDIRFSLADPKAVRDAARRKAVEDARASAELYAKAAGVELGAVRRISDLGDGASIPPMMRSAKMMAAAAPASVPVETGEDTYSADVRMVFDIAR